MQWVATEQGFLTAFGRWQDEPLKFEGYQDRFLREVVSRFRCVEKSRQVGYSFAFAAEAVARCHLREKHTAVFVSYNLEDAKEKILYAHQIAEELPAKFRKRIETDSKTELGFTSLDGKKISRIISNPCKAPRGKGGDIYLDELAHYTFDRDVYKGSTALIARVKGQLTICSTPLGRRGVFWEIARQEMRPYERFWRQRAPWWICSFFCTDVPVAADKARAMPTEQRVREYGTQDLQDQFDALMLEDFQQEFELAYIDESYSFYPYDLILPCTYDSDVLKIARDVTDIKTVKGRLVAGYDVGRDYDFSELAVFEEDEHGAMKARLFVKYDRVPFHTQRSEIRRVLNLLPVARFTIDNTGMGKNLAEDLENEFPQVERFNFTNESKEVMAHDFKILLQKKDIMLPRDRDLVAQIHSIKRRLTPTGKPSFDAEPGATGRGHADRFWACALACQKERAVRRVSGPVSVGVRVVG